jgi:hypothetical protein
MVNCCADKFFIVGVCKAVKPDLGGLHGFAGLSVSSKMGNFRRFEGSPETSQVSPTPFTTLPTPTFFMLDPPFIINLTADADTLASVSGMGPATAEAIRWAVGEQPLGYTLSDDDPVP